MGGRTVSNPLDLQVAGLDPSLTSFGWATSTGVGTIRSKARDEKRLIEIRTAVLEHTRGSRLAIIEGPAYGAQYAREVLGGLLWVIRVALFGNRITSVVVPPAKVKQFACDNGAATKDEMVAAARAELLYFGDSDDEADALWLRQMGLAAYGCAAITVEPHRERVLGTIDWPVRIAPISIT